MESTSKTWTELMTPFSQFWLESSSQAWKNWFDLMAQGGAMASPNQTFESLPQQFQQSQQFYGEMLKLSFQAWQSIWPKLTANGSGQADLQGYLEQLQTQIQQYASGTQTLQGDLDGLWQYYLKEVQKFSQLWLSTWQSSIAPLGKLPTGDVYAWLDLNNLYGDALYSKNLGSFMRSPLLGPSREMNGKLLGAFDDWVKLSQAMADYQLLEADIQYRGFAALMEDLLAQAKEDKPVKTWKEFQQRWAIAADQVFEAAFCEEKNLKIRGKFINALNRYRIQQQSILEAWLKTFNLPTRSEVDEIHQTIYQLRKEVKSLKKRLGETETNPG
ncbi:MULTISPECIES: class III poly(R)-hydroxyalkanoic acid synthase subunit PhaE [unclassified Synechocystis]|uniref:class III poly(R)-hydroxyalkanoic acid synthase subunit PhaE n=1 Tax=unclassified Synechocystis TaxID=2640012 RepID=UPI00040069B9|nr:MULTISPECIES: class III poly(R)-hydroxyalkanoic acid synthase subunit PhaE [unclassified Synechocystis]MCT0253621.1 class III poly(R)-hydroxyalkanoic acid synthase subunit PhaE [Synechocystis sp. CS-94]